MIGKLHVTRCCKGKMKSGIDIPATVKEAVIFDKANINTLWQDAIKIDIKNSRVAFKSC